LTFSPTNQRRALWLAAIIAVIAYYPRFHKGDGLEVFTAAAGCMLRGVTPLHCKTVIFAYPPFFAMLAVPLTAMPMWLRDVFWYALLIGTIFAALRLCEVLARKLFPGTWSERDLALLRVLTFVLTLKFILAVLENQAYDSIAFCFILLGILALSNGRSALGAASFATAAALKVTPVIFLPYLLFKRRFIAALVFVVVLVVLTLLPDMLLPPNESWHSVVWVREVALAPFIGGSQSQPHSFWVTDSPMNQAFHAAVARAFGEVSQPRQFALTLHILSGVYVAVVGVLLLKSRTDDRLVAVDGALLVASALLLSPVSSQSHFIGLMLAYALLAAALIKVPSLRTFTAIGLATSFVLLTATSNDSVGRAFTGWALSHNLPIWGTVVLVAMLGGAIWSGAVKRALA
jgi:alpha-1,2-mannosyltransferase